jgi:AraC family transcriptional regulator
MISVYHNSPEQVKESELKWDIGFPVSAETSVKDPLKKAFYAKKTVLEYMHKGPYEKLVEVYKKLDTYIKEKKMTILLPTYEFYLNSPMQVKPEELLTRIEIPIKK